MHSGINKTKGLRLFFGFRPHYCYHRGVVSLGWYVA
jgi:hypothetical protein